MTVCQCVLKHCRALTTISRLPLCHPRTQVQLVLAYRLLLALFFSQFQLTLFLSFSAFSDLPGISSFPVTGKLLVWSPVYVLHNSTPTLISLSLMPFSFEAFSVRFSSSSRLNWRIALLVFQCKSDSYLIIWCAWVCWFSEIAVEQLPHCRALYQAERGRNNKRYIPVKLLDLLESLISVRYSRIKWENGWSEIFSIHFGVRQGSVLSPFLFAVYLDDLSILCDSDSSSYIILYADDILLIAPSLSKLECILHACERELTRLDMAINCKKSCCLWVGSRCDAVCGNIVSASGQVIVWVTETLPRRLCHSVKNFQMLTRTRKALFLPSCQCRICSNR